MADMVTVACKLPYGLILKVDKQTIKLNGIMQSRSVQAPFFMAAPHIVGLTQIPKALWEAWIKQNKEYPAYKKGLIFAAKNQASAFAEAKEKADLDYGLKRLDPNSLCKTHSNVSLYSPNKT